MDLIKILSKEFKTKEIYMKNIIDLIDEGNTIPFIARYRKEMTGQMDDQALAMLAKRLSYLRILEEKKEQVIGVINDTGAMTKELMDSINASVTHQELEDIYRPYKPKRRTRATQAKEKGLDPLAVLIAAQDHNITGIEKKAQEYIDPEKGVNNEEEALQGAMDIIAEEISDNAAFRKTIREDHLRNGVLTTKAKTEEDSVYKLYYSYSEPVLQIPSHRILAIFRAEKEGYISIRITAGDVKNTDFIKSKVLVDPPAPSTKYVEKAIDDAYFRLLQPSIVNEVRNELFEKAAEKAVRVFAENLRNLLLTPPLKNKRILGLDPAYRTGCKIAVIDENGKLLDTGVIYPTPPQNKVKEAEKKLISCIGRYDIDVIAIGNGTASRESEIFVADAIRKNGRNVKYTIVNEAGASIYSASKLAAEEFPDLDVSIRSAVSIARRLQDPLAELVKIDPASIGIGQYQHDMDQKKLSEALTVVVEACVNNIGVDLNTASTSLLSYIAGIGPALAGNIIEYRDKHGGFKSRRELLKVSKLGPKAFKQCAGFLRIPESSNILDNTAVHPESYDAAARILQILGYAGEDIGSKGRSNIEEEIVRWDIHRIAAEAGIGEPTLFDIVKELSKPGRDPRDDLPMPRLLEGVMDIEDLKPGMEVEGTVRNVSGFGAFVDIGVHQDGLVHISQMSNRYVRDPMDIVSVGDVVKVTVLDVDISKKRISLSMRKDPKKTGKSIDS